MSRHCATVPSAITATLALAANGGALRAPDRLPLIRYRA